MEQNLSQTTKSKNIYNFIWWAITIIVLLYFLLPFADWIKLNFKYQMSSQDYIALNLTIIEILLALVSLIVAGVAFIGFFTIRGQIDQNVSMYMAGQGKNTMREIIREEIKQINIQSKKENSFKIETGEEDKQVEENRGGEQS